MGNEVWERVDGYTEKIGSAISELANQLGVAREYVFQLLVRQQITDAIVELLLFGALIGLIVLLIIKGLPKAREFDDRVNDEFFIVTLLSVVAVLSFILLLQSIFVVPDAIKQLINPEYYAIKEAFKLIEGMIK